MWKVGIIGAGYWSEKHVRAWQSIETVQINGFCDKNAELLKEKGELFHIPSENLYLDIINMMENADIDVIDIVTPPETHLELVKLAAKAGKHIMCQKPFANTLEEAEEMVKIANEAGVRLMVTENWRWLEPFQIMKSMLAENIAGIVQTVRYIHTDWYSPRFSPEKNLPQPFFRDMPKLLFFEMGVHWFDTWRFLFGEPKRLYAETKQISPFIEGEDTGLIMLGYDDFFGYMDMSWATRRDLEAEVPEQVLPDHKEQLIIEGDKATIKLYNNGRISIIDNKGAEKTYIESTELNYIESHKNLHAHFIECLNEGTDFQTSGEDNLKTLQLVFGTYESSQNKQVIHF
ncbi:Gfo/Idh/MocA family protein [Niallia sp. MER 6]|uniref:Gfo/Idh/MocA family protein n=1 Tax=Niallia sp. MER 6 TaxID=2939567 RepID=UPI002042345E|nr:Gfo/Idh/MocA family oxidoreductase [Niallia sp. MER 6]MCM3033152.1 Gfo/Idh/MocA family oxidoreductase [Niallia sp. MER 6]